MKKYLALILIIPALLIFLFISSRKTSEQTSLSDIVSGSETEEKTQKEYVSPISIDYLRTMQIDSAAPSIEEELEKGSNYRRYVASYYSEGNKVFGLLTVPDIPAPDKGFPAIVFNHGYIPPENYVTTQGYVAYVDYLARNGFVVFKIDFRGNGNSEGDPSGSYFSSAYTIDAISAVKSLKKFGSVDPERIGMWGHSMSGNVLLRAMLVSEDIKAGVVWAGAVYSYKDFAEYGISDNSYVRRPPQAREDFGQANRESSEEVQKIRSDPKSIDFNNAFWKSVSLTENIKYLKYPLQVHHAKNDPVVNIGYSRDLEVALKENNKNYEIFEYDGGGHNINSPYFEQAMESTVRFFQESL